LLHLVGDLFELMNVSEPSDWNSVSPANPTGYVPSFA